ncbi:UNVERIFIED_CONTAM: hypothetical protein HDU68_005988 [Siphonaria sp. JEL0065]|nr:hypothetical protein HDU68_005988 [Siphonaria sp. JEL0065]
MSHPLLNINIAPSRQLPSDASTIQQSPYHGPRQRRSTQIASYIAQNHATFPTQSYTTIRNPNANEFNTANLLEDQSIHSTSNNSVYCDDSISCQNISELLDPHETQNYNAVDEEEEGIDLLLAKVESALQFEETVMSVHGLQHDENEEDSDLVLMKAVNDALKGKEGVSRANISGFSTQRIPCVPLHDELGGAMIDRNASPAGVSARLYASSAPSASRFEVFSPITPMQYNPSNPNNTPNYHYPMYSSDAYKYSPLPYQQTPNHQNQPQQYQQNIENEYGYPSTPIKYRNNYADNSKPPLSAARVIQHAQISTSTEMKPTVKQPSVQPPVYHVPKIEYDSFWTRADDDTFIERVVAPVMAKYSK